VYVRVSVLQEDSLDLHQTYAARFLVSLASIIMISEFLSTRDFSTRLLAKLEWYGLSPLEEPVIVGTIAMSSRDKTSPVSTADEVASDSQSIDEHQPRTPERLVGNNPSANAGVGTDVVMLMASHFAPPCDTVFHHEPLLAPPKSPIAQASLTAHPISGMAVGSEDSIPSDVVCGGFIGNISGRNSLGNIPSPEDALLNPYGTRGLPDHRLARSIAADRRVHWQHQEGSADGFTAPLLDPFGMSELPRFVLREGLDFV